MTPVTVGARTLEHWAGTYLTYRYRSQASLWWPTPGEDLDLADVPLSPGRVVHLEMLGATTTPEGAHEVRVDLGRLWEDSHLPLWAQPYYVFPWPTWSGSLAELGRRSGFAASEAGMRRVGPGRWFADWTVVLTTAQVRGVLAAELSAHGRADRGELARLVQVVPGQRRGAWGASGKVSPAPDVVRWLELWPELETGGRDGWPQLLLVPRSAASAPGTRMPRPGVLAALRSEAEGELVALVPAGNGEFIVLDRVDLGAPLGSSPPDDRSHRVGVFVEAAATR